MNKRPRPKPGKIIVLPGPLYYTLTAEIAQMVFLLIVENVGLNWFILFNFISDCGIFPCGGHNKCVPTGGNHRAVSVLST